MIRQSIISIAVASLLTTTLYADTIRLKNGSTLRGRVLRFDGKEFTVMIEGTQSRAFVSSNDVVSIDFDEPTNTAGTQDRRSVSKEEIEVPGGSKGTAESTKGPVETTGPPRGGPARSSPKLSNVREFTFEVSAKEVWADSGIDLKIGQKVRISATGRVTIAADRTTGPEGIQLEDRGKLMQDRPTGSLIGVIGDDNDEFFLVGVAKEFVAQREGRLFLMVNEGNLEDNSGAFSVRVQVETNEQESVRP